MLNSVIGLVIGSLKFALGSVAGVGPVMEATVGQRAAETLVEEQK